MKHRTTARFWACFARLPQAVQTVARRNFKLLKENPAHPSLHFKKVGRLWSARAGPHHRALAVEDGAELCGLEDPLRRFLIVKETRFREIKDLRDDICHRSAYGRLRSATFPGFMEIMRAGGGKAPFASEADLRSYLCVLFQRWLAFANIVGEFAARRVREDYPEHPFTFPGGFIVADGEIDVTTSTPEPLFPVGTTIMTVSEEGLASLEYFLRPA